MGAGEAVNGILFQQKKDSIASNKRRACINGDTAQCEEEKRQARNTRMWIPCWAPKTCAMPHIILLVFQTTRAL